jgi:hypothetical protein
MARLPPWLIAALAAALLLPGCASDAEPEPAPVAGPVWVTVDPVVLAEGSYKWHETGTGGANAMEYYDLASQAVAHPCVWDGGGGGEEVYFNNLQLPTARASEGLGPWSGNLTITLDWTDQDWVGTALRVAYQAPGLDGWRQTMPIERGSTLVESIHVQPAEDEEEGYDVTEWSVWVCLGEDTGSGVPEPFVGSVQAQVVFAPDPILQGPVEAPPAEDEGRTARDG